MTDNDGEFRHTGLWPFNLFPGKGRPVLHNGQPVRVFDPLALAFEAGGRLHKSGWPGLELMSADFLWKVVDAEADVIDGLLTDWFTTHRRDVAEALEARLETYKVDEIAQTAMSQALYSYRAGHFLAVVRTLIPEFERFGRSVASKDGTLPERPKQAVDAMQAFMDSVPARDYPMIESVTAFYTLSEELFVRWFPSTEMPAGVGPNRHAEVHGLASFGHLRGASKMLQVTDFVFFAATLAGGLPILPDK